MFYWQIVATLLIGFISPVIMGDLNAAGAQTYGGCPVEVIDLGQFENHLVSQNGEDGIIEMILSKIGTSSKFCVEFGAYDGFHCSNTLQLRNAGWKALLLDDSHENLEVNLHKAFICKENINELFEKYYVPYDLDFLSIDIDFNDFHVWQAISDAYRPRLVVIEYNATFPPGEDKVVVYDHLGHWDGTNYFGASIQAMYNLARKKGYSLVYAENTGANLFFVRDDLLENQNFCFKNVNDIYQLYKKPTYGNGPNGGHPQDPLNRVFTSSEKLLHTSYTQTS
jgi:hypothetical protein